MTPGGRERVPAGGSLLGVWRMMMDARGERAPTRFGGQQLSNDVEDVPHASEEFVEPRSLRSCSGFVRANFSLLTLAGCLVGLAVGYGAREAELGEEGVLLLGYAGELFVRSLKAPLAPMIFCSMICCTNLHAHTASRLAPKFAVLCYALSTVLASTTGVLAFVLIRPGSHVRLDASFSEPSAAQSGSAGGGPNAVLDSLLELGREIVPDNMLQAMVQMKLISVITAGVAVGVAIRHTAPLHPDATAPLLAMAKGTFEALLVLISWLVMAAPLGVCSMVAACVAATPDLAAVASGLGVLVLATAAAMAFHLLLSLSLLLYLAAPAQRPLPWAYLRGVLPALSMAFGTASSAATLSTSIEAVVAQGVRREVAAFVLPLGATVNMDGSAIGITLSVLYLANASGQLAAMNALDIANVGLVGALLSVGAAPVPSSGLVTLILCLEATGVAVTPLTAYVLAIDWLTDRMRTAVNVASDAVVCAAVDRLIRRGERGEPAEPARSELPAPSERGDGPGGTARGARADKARGGALGGFQSLPPPPAGMAQPPAAAAEYGDETELVAR